MAVIKSEIKLAVFDLSGTTVGDDTGVRDCLYNAAVEFGLPTTPEEILNHMGMNKIHLYQFLIARSRGVANDIRQFEIDIDESLHDEAVKIYDHYNAMMVAHYRNHCEEIPGSSDVFRWCHANGIKVATNTGFHREVTDAIMEKTGWIRDGLVDLSVDLNSVPEGKGRPSPFMIFHAMQYFNVQNVREVIKLGDTPADMLEGYNAGCRAVIGVLTEARSPAVWGKHWHTHLVESVRDLPRLVEEGHIV